MLSANFHIRKRTDGGAGASFIYEPMTGDGAKTDHYHIEAILHTAKKDIRIQALNGIYIDRDYRQNYADDFKLVAMIPLNDYLKVIYPNKENLELTMTLTRIKAGTGTIDKQEEKIIDYYKVLLNAEGNLPVDESMLHRPTNVEHLVDVKMQLFDLGAEILRNKTARGSFSNSDNGQMDVKQILQSLVKAESDAVEVMQKPAVDAIDVAEISNQGAVRNLLIPDSVKLFDVADYLQTHGSGLYAEGAGMYVQRYQDKKTVFIYPIYRVTKEHYDSTKYKKCEIVLTSSNDIASTSSTTVTENFLKFVAIGGMDTLNHTTVRELNGSTGFTSMDTELFASYDMDKVMRDGLIPTISRKPFVTRVDRGNVMMESSSLLANRFTNVKREDKVEVIDSSIQHSTNLFNRAAQLLKNRVVLAQVKWQNALLFDVYPCMPCKVRYFDKDGDVKEVYGVILSIQYYMAKDGPNQFTKSFKTHASVTLALDRYALES